MVAHPWTLVYRGCGFGFDRIVNPMCGHPTRLMHLGGCDSECYALQLPRR